MNRLHVITFRLLIIACCFVLMFGDANAGPKAIAVTFVAGSCKVT
jgi:hypothetical protein